MPHHQGDTSENSIFNETLYRKTLFTRMIPICTQTHPEDWLESTSALQENEGSCSDFIPSISNHGFCVTRNRDKLDTIFKQNNHMKSFATTFIPTNYVDVVKNISKKQSDYHFTFIIDGNQYKNLKRGMFWNVTLNKKFKIGIHSPQEIADVRGWDQKMISASAGHITEIKIKLSEQKSERLIEEVPILNRKCRFQDENENLASIKWYSKVNCLLDCKMKVAADACGCRPWDYPHTNVYDNDEPETRRKICDFFGNSCFNKILRQDVTHTCGTNCLPSCNTISYSIDISKTPIDPQRRICDTEVDPESNLELNIKQSS